MVLKILNANLWLISRGVSRDIQKRMENFVAMVDKLDPDVILLQEVWKVKYANYLKKALPKYYSVSSEKFWLANKCGLVAFSKLPVYDVSFIEYDSKKGSSLLEKLAKKGILSFKIKYEGSEIGFYTAHLYNWSTAKEKQFTISQLVEFVQLAKTKTSISAGDLNLKLDEVQNVCKGLISIDESVENTVSENNPYTKGKIHKNMSKMGENKLNRKTDYFLFNFPLNKIVTQTKVIRDPLVSDHYPLFTEIKIK